MNTKTTSAVAAQTAAWRAEDGFDKAVEAKLALESNVSTPAEPAAPPAGTLYAATGRGIEWPQIGIGFGVGILLAFGFALGARSLLRKASTAAQVSP